MKQTLLFILSILLSSFLIAQDSQNMSLLNQWTDSTLPPTNAFNNPYNEVWGYASDDAEYAIIGSTMGVHFIDVSDPENIEEVAFVEGAATGAGIIHRDYHDYNGYLYSVCDEGASTLQIMDLSYLPDSVPLVYDSNDLVKRAHNVFIDVAMGKLYAVGVTPASGSYVGIRIISLDDPVNPTLLGDMLVGEGVHDIFVRNDTAYVNKGGSGFHVYEVSDAESPELLGTMLDYEGQGYNHAGYLSDDGNTYILADETHGSPVKIVDVSDMSDIEITTTMESGIHPNSIPHNVLILDNYVYVSYYYDGVYVWDFSDTSDPILVGYYDTSEIPNGTGYQGCWGVYPYLPSGLVLASDMQEGLFVLELDQTVGINNQELSALAFNLYPNPAQDQFYVSFDNKTHKEVEISIFSMSGQRIYSELTNKSTTLIQSSDFEKGVYFIELKGAGVSTKKLIIN